MNASDPVNPTPPASTGLKGRWQAFRQRRGLRKLAIGLLAITTLGAGTAFAMGRHHHHGMMGEHMARHIDRLGERLKLNDTQKAAWDTARQRTRDAMDAGRSERMQGMDALRAQLATGNADLRAFSREVEQRKARFETAMSGVRDAWLDVYDTLDETQKREVNRFMSERLSRGKGMREPGLGPRGMWDGDMQSGDGPETGRGPAQPRG